jgi:hypothetical protein
MSNVRSWATSGSRELWARLLTRTLIAYALSMCIGLSTVTVAGSVTQPGETVGVPAGAPLPEGLYFANTADWGCRNTNPTSCLGITIPIVAWSTPWTFLGARVQFFSVTPVIDTLVNNTSYQVSVFNPALFGQLAWDVGNGFGFSYALGAYFDVQGLQPGLHQCRPDGDQEVRQMAVRTGGLRLCRPHESDRQLPETNPGRDRRAVRL